MPGRTPPAAYDAFIGPIRTAVSCLGRAHVSTSPGCREPGAERSWSLNGLEGHSSGPWHFEAKMGYEIIEDHREGYGPWRATTTQYAYKLSHGGADIFRLHWHPLGDSPVKEPHVHARLAPENAMPNSLKAHLRIGRMTLEDAIRWSIELGLPSGRDDWAACLERTEGPHLEHRSWDDRPGLEVAGQPAGRHRAGS